MLTLQSSDTSGAQMNSGVDPWKLSISFAAPPSSLTTIKHSSVYSSLVLLHHPRLSQRLSIVQSTLSRLHALTFDTCKNKWRINPAILVSARLRVMNTSAMRPTSGPCCCRAIILRIHTSRVPPSVTAYDAAHSQRPNSRRNGRHRALVEDTTQQV